MATTKINPSKDILPGTLPATVLAPTALTGDNDTSIASTAFVQQEINANTVYFTSDFTGTGSISDPIANTPLYFSNKFTGVGTLGNPFDLTYPVSSLTTTGTSGVATLSGGVLNIPNYTATSFAWGNITGSILSQTDLIAYIAANTSGQTPWASNINGNQYNLTNVKDIQVVKVIPSTNENYVLSSGDISNATYWTIGGATVIINDANDLDGNLTLDRFTNPTTSQESLTQLVSNLTPGTTYYVSWDIKNLTQTSAHYEFYDFSNFATISGEVDYFGSISGTTSRVEFSFVCPVGCTTVRIRPFINNFTTGAIDIGRIMICRGAGATYQLTTTTQLTGTVGSTTYAISTNSANGKTGFNKQTPTETIDAVGNIRFSGALMPNNTAGTSGQFLISGGTGGPNTWQTGVTLSSLTAATGTNSINNANNQQTWNWNSLGSGGVGLLLQTTSTSQSGSSRLLDIVTGGTQSSSAVTYGATINNNCNIPSGTSYGLQVTAGNASFTSPSAIAGDFVSNGSLGTNIAGRFSATSGYAIIVPASSGKVGIGNSAPISTLDVTGGSLGLSLVTKTGTYTADTTDHTILCSTNTFTINLPAASTCTGRVYTIKNITTATTITVDGNAAETIDGATTYSLAAQYKYVTVQSNGTNWFIIGNN